VENKVYVSNIANATSTEQLETLFSKVGKVVRINMIVNAATGVRRGAAYIEMQTEMSIEKAINAFDGYILDSQALVVREAGLGVNRPPRHEESTGNRL
jgi:RNA recognition motif-containing protein